ncbi:MAG: replication protein [Candidatus Rhabdochlamydia sp.]
MNNYIPNTSSIPNILFDYWMNILTPAEFKVLMCIARKTYGWHKDVDRISISQIEKMTGLSRKGITKNLDSLLQYGLINKIKSKTVDGDDAANQYEINVNCMGGGSELSSPGVVNSVHYGVVNSVHPQKKTYTKETIQNIIPPITPQISEKIPSESIAAKAARDENFSSKSKKEKPEFSPEVRDVANKMVNALVNVNPDWLVPKNLQPILSEIAKMINEQKRDPLRILKVFKWAINDEFWLDKISKPNPAKYLNEKFGQLAAKMDAKPPSNPNQVDRRLRDKDGDVVDKWKDDLW